MQYGEVAANNMMKLKRFAHSLTGAAFTSYTNLPQKYVLNWQDIKWKFHNQFYRIEPEVSMASCLYL